MCFLDDANISVSSDRPISSSAGVAATSARFRFRGTSLRVQHSGYFTNPWRVFERGFKHDSYAVTRYDCKVAVLENKS